MSLRHRASLANLAPLVRRSCLFRRSYAMLVNIQVLGIGVADASPSVVLNVDNKRYLFNCGEGTQRLCNEYKIRLKKFDQIFLTRVAWEYIGGLPGTVMTMADAGATQINVHGPTNILQFFYATRLFMYRRSVDVNVQEYTQEQDCDKPLLSDVFDDGDVRVTPIILNPSERGQKRGYLGQLPTETKRIMLQHLQKENDPNKESNDDTARLEVEGFQNTRGRSHDRDVLVPNTPTLPHPPVASYVIQTSPVPGKFDVSKAKALGVPKGPLYAVLKSGQSITLEDGRIVYPQDCVAAPSPGPIVLVVDCPDDLYIDALANNSWSAACESPPRVMLHMAPRHVLHNTKYIEWIGTVCDSTTQHIVLSDDGATEGPVVYQKAIGMNMRLAALSPKTFAVPKTSAENSSRIADLVANGFPSKSVLGAPLMQYNLVPLAKSNLVQTGRPEPPCMVALKDETLRLLRDANMDVEYNSDSVSSPSAIFEPSSTKVVFLGTGSAIPSKYRNVSSTLVTVDGQYGILLDAGEGTLGQLTRMVGRSNIHDYLRRIRVAFISHMHADHHLGLIRLLLHYPRDEPPLTVVGPPSLKLWLDEYSLIERLQYTYVAAISLVENDSNSNPSTPKMSVELPGVKMTCVKVSHCAHATGCVLKHDSGWKIVYSGDTQPCPALIDKGKDATVLIHEATFDDELVADARAKRHSTTGEAVQAGVEMGARLIMLNHFSQRYPKIPKISPTFSDRTGIAFDMMSIDLAHLQTVPKLLDPLKIVFAEEHAELWED